MMVPFLDLRAHHAPLHGDFLQSIARVIESGEFIGGAVVERFEENFARYCGCSHAIGVGSGTDALWLALVALGIGRGDEVITAPNSFIATLEAIVRTGARPVFADVDPVTLNIDPSKVEDAISERTRAIVPVHLFGQCSEMDPLLAIARNHGLAIVEDAAQAHGATDNGRRAGSMGDAGCFSFYPGKNLGAFGEAGAVVTNDPSIAARIRSLRNHGQREKYQHDLLGWNCRLDSIQAAVLDVKLRFLDAANEARRARAAEYHRALRGQRGIVLPVERRGAGHVYHLFPVRVADRDLVRDRLRASGVECGIHYPVPVHLQPACGYLGHVAGSFPIAEKACAELLSLPMFPDLSTAQVRFVSELLAGVLGETTNAAA